MKINHVHHLRKGFSLVELLVVIAIIAALAGVSYGPIISKMKDAEKNSAITQATNLYKALTGFALENEGDYPGEITAKSHQGYNSPEDCFNQLLDAGDIKDESIFWTKANRAIGTVKSAKPDGDGQLQAGECAWGYVSGLTVTEQDTRVPLFFDSSSSAGDFDTAVWEGQAIVARVNGSVAAMDIDYGSGQAIENGQSKTGSITEKRGSTYEDIFSTSNLPDAAEVLVPGN